jgi:hypothetical protein
VNVGVLHGLASTHSVIEADVEPIGMVLLDQLHSRLANKLPNSSLVGNAQLVNGADVATWGNQSVSFTDRVSTGKAIAASDSTMVRSARIAQNGHDINLNLMISPLKCSCN